MKKKYVIVTIVIILAIIIFATYYIFKNKENANEDKNTVTLEQENNLDSNTRLQMVQTKIDEQENIIKGIQEEINPLNQKEEELIAEEGIKGENSRSNEEITKELEELTKKKDKKQEELTKEMEKVNKLYEEYNSIMSEYSSGVQEQ